MRPPPLSVPGPWCPPLASRPGTVQEGRCWRVTLPCVGCDRGPGQCSFAHPNLAQFPVTLAGDAVGVGELGSPVGAAGDTRRPD